MEDFMIKKKNKNKFITLKGDKFKNIQDSYCILDGNIKEENLINNIKTIEEAAFDEDWIDDKHYLITKYHMNMLKKGHY